MQWSFDITLFFIFFDYIFIRISTISSSSISRHSTSTSFTATGATVPVAAAAHIYDHKRACYRDQSCLDYDDCCKDSPWARTTARRQEIGAKKLAELRAQWHCHKVNPIFGDVLLKASCVSDWLSSQQQADLDAARLIKRRCEYFKYTTLNSDSNVNNKLSNSSSSNGNGKTNHHNQKHQEQHMQLDPVGTMLPITDLSSGITYANSYCLRCNQLTESPRLIYWSPLLECNYNLDSDDRNTLYDLISTNKGQILQYSSERNKWIIGPQAVGGERACSITPTIPEAAEHIVRFCRANWPIITNDTAAATINGQLQGDGVDAFVSYEAARGRGGAGSDGTALSGSFSVLMDLYSSSQGDEQVGAVHQCPDTQRQVYDPFFLTCRDVVCGFNHHYVDGKCISTKDGLKFKGDLVEKFKPAMVYVTSVCLVVSSLSLAMYLLLHWLSMMDLRSLLADMAIQQQHQQPQQQEQEKQQQEQRKWCPGRCDSETSVASSSIIAQQQQQERETARNQSLSSRGVACLAGSLLAAYVLFLFGHHGGLWAEHATVSCMIIAIGTYYCFLVAFSWMFLLSYDIWRTLRLATCQLRGPALHAQSGRFLIYSLLALFSSALIVGASVLIDQAGSFGCKPPSSSSSWSSSSNNVALLSNQDSLPVSAMLAQPLIDNDNNNNYTTTTTTANTTHQHLLNHTTAKTDTNSMTSDGSTNCTHLEAELAHFIHTYRPKFGQRAGSCWFSNRRALALFFGLPVTLIMMLNLLFFLHSSFMVIRTSSRSSRHLRANSSDSGSSVSKKLASMTTIASDRFVSVLSLGSSDSSLGSVSTASDSSLSHFQSLGCMVGSIAKDFRLYGRLSTIMGLTWLTGLIASLVDQSDTLWYLFVVLNTLQGMFIFIAFGCKRSKLTNLEILVEYARFRWHKVRTIFNRK